MKLSLNNFLYGVKQIVTGGGDSGVNDAGFLHEEQSLLDSAGYSTGTTDLGESHFVVPRDYDEATDEFKLKVAGRMAGSTDTPDIDVVISRTRVGESDVTTLTSTTIITLDDTYDTAELDLSGEEFKRGDHLDVAVTSGAHATDAIERLTLIPIYRSCLVSYHEEDSDGNPLR